jgi:hypothetical protein
MGNLKQILPGLFPQPPAQSRLHFFPGRQRALELRFSVFGQAQPPLPAILAGTLRDPAFPSHDPQGATERRTVHGENFAQLVLIHLSRQRQRLHDGELRAAQAQRAERLFIQLGECPGRPAKVAAHARQFRKRGTIHIKLDVYTSIMGARKFLLERRLSDFT